MLVLPLNIYSPECQDVSFFQSGEKHYFCSGSISVDPICLQPRLLCEAGADKDKSMVGGTIPLMVGSTSGWLSVLPGLTEDTDGSGSGATPLLKATQQGHTEVVRALCEAGADKDYARGDGATALWCAAAEGHPAIVRLLCGVGADKDRATLSGTTPLFAACEEGNSEVVQLLLEARADKDCAQRHGTTALWCAAAEGHGEVARPLRDQR